MSAYSHSNNGSGDRRDTRVGPETNFGDNGRAEPKHREYGSLTGAVAADGAAGRTAFRSTRRTISMLSMIVAVAEQTLARLAEITPAVMGLLAKKRKQMASLLRQRRVMESEFERVRELLEREETDELPEKRQLVHWIYLALTSVGLVGSGVASWMIGAYFVKEFYGDPTWLRGLVYSSPIPLMGFVLKQLVFSIWPPDSRGVKAVVLAVALLSLGVFGHSFSQRYAVDSYATDGAGGSGFSVSGGPLEGASTAVPDADIFKRIFFGQMFSELTASMVLYWTFSLLIVPQTGQRWRYFTRRFDRLNLDLDGMDGRIAGLEEEIAGIESELTEAAATDEAVATMLQSFAVTPSRIITSPKSSNHK